MQYTNDITSDMFFVLFVLITAACQESQVSTSSSKKRPHESGNSRGFLNEPVNRRRFQTYIR